AVNAQAVTDYLNAQIEAGAQAVMIFDSWGGSLTPHAYKEFSLAYMEQIVAGLIKEREGRRIPSIIFTKGGGNWLDAMADIGADAIGLDWTVDIGTVRRQVGDRVALQGNLDPCALHGTPDSIRAEVRRIVESYGNHPGHVFNLGHGISQFTDPDNVAVLVEAVHSMSRAVRTSSGN
ncbi:MAG: uroporphyrinogen decarboxylase family protein, partial [Gammaproteobacteria bacterium]